MKRVMGGTIPFSLGSTRGLACSDRRPAGRLPCAGSNQTVRIFRDSEVAGRAPAHTLEAGGPPPPKKIFPVGATTAKKTNSKRHGLRKKIEKRGALGAPLKTP